MQGTVKHSLTFLPNTGTVSSEKIFRGIYSPRISRGRSGIVLVLQFAQLSVKPPGELGSRHSVDVALESDIVPLVGLDLILQLDLRQASELVQLHLLDLFTPKFRRSVADWLRLLRGSGCRLLEPSLGGLETTIAQPGIVVQRETPKATS